MDAAEPGGLGGTYAGSPIACAAALAVLDVIDDEQLIPRADAIRTRVVDHLHALARREDLRPIGHVRGLRALYAFDLLVPRGPDEHPPAAAPAVTSQLGSASCTVRVWQSV